MASEKTVMAQTRSIIIDRLKHLERMEAHKTYRRDLSYGYQTFGRDSCYRDWQVLNDEYEFYTNFLLYEAKLGTKFTEVALSEAVRDRSVGGPRATEV